MNKKYVKSKLKSNDEYQLKNEKIEVFATEPDVLRMKSLFMESGNKMFEYNKFKKNNKNENEPKIEQMDSLKTGIGNEKKIKEWINFKDQIKKEMFLIETPSYRNNQKDGEEKQEGNDQNFEVQPNIISFKSNKAPIESINQNEIVLKNPNEVDILKIKSSNKKAIKIIDNIQLENILINQNYDDEPRIIKDKEKEKYKREANKKQIIRKATSTNNNVILLKPQIVSSEKQKFFEREKNGNVNNNELIHLMSNNKEIYNQNFIDNKLREFQSKIENIWEKKSNKAFNDIIIKNNLNLKKNQTDKEDEFLNVYAHTHDKIKEIEEKKSLKEVETVYIDKNKESFQKSKENNNLGCLARLAEWINPTSKYLDPDIKKHNWYGKYGAFSKKFKDTREYKY